MSKRLIASMALCLIIGFTAAQILPPVAPLEVAASEEARFMATEFSLQALHDEIENDPMGLGYKEAGGAWKEDAVIVELINSTEGPGAANIMRKLITPDEIWTSIPYSEYEAYSDAKREWLDTCLELVGGDGLINANDSVMYANLIAVFPAGSDARANILAQIQRTGSRAEVLWGEGTVISISQVGHAANL